MMKNLILSMYLLALISCNDRQKQEKSTATDAQEQAIEANNEHPTSVVSEIYSNSWTNEIKMDNGIKWKANEATNAGVKKMKNSLKNPTVTLSDYHILAAELDSDKNYVVKNCTMKGASHDNLHVWLLPLIAKINALSEAKTLDDAEKIKQSLEENINAYDNYFE